MSGTVSSPRDEPSDSSGDAAPPPRRRATRGPEAAAASRRETRRLLLEAAGELFAERGYAASTVTAIAERAGVSLQTLYLAWGSKRDLLRAFVESALSGSETGIDHQEWAPHLQAEITADAAGSPGPRAQLRAMAHRFRLIAAEGAGRPAAALAWKLYRDAAATDPEIAADWAGLQLLRRDTFARLLAHLPPEVLRPGLTPQAAADSAWVIASPETYDLLVHHGGYALDAYEEWVAATLITTLLPDE